MTLIKNISVILGVGAISALSACVQESSAPAASASAGGLPAFSASCPNNIEVNSDGSGPVYINAQAASVKKYSDAFYEAVLGDVTASISLDGNGASVSYNKRGVGNGVCRSNT